MLYDVWNSVLQVASDAPLSTVFIQETGLLPPTETVLAILVKRAEQRMMNMKEQRENISLIIFNYYF